MKFDRLSSQDRDHLIEAVASIFQKKGAEAARALLTRVSPPALRFLRTLHAKEIVNEAVRLWVNAPRSRNTRVFRAALAGALLPKYRATAAREVEEALAGHQRTRKVVDVEAEVR